MLFRRSGYILLRDMMWHVPRVLPGKVLAVIFLVIVMIQFLDQLVWGTIMQTLQTQMLSHSKKKTYILHTYEKSRESCTFILMCSHSGLKHGYTICDLAISPHTDSSSSNDMMVSTSAQF